MDTDTLTQPHSENPQPIRPERLYRSIEQRAVAGVAGGLGDRYDINPAWFRVAFIILSLTGVGLVLYGAGWLLIPEEGEDTSLAARWFGGVEGRGAWVGVLLMGGAALIALGSFDFIDGGFLWAVALAGLGFLLYRGDIGPASRSGTPPNSTPPSSATTVADEVPLMEDEAGLPEIYDGAGSGAGGVDKPLGGRAERPRRPRQPASILGRLAIAAALLTVGIMAAFDNAGVTSPYARQYIAAVVLVVGIALLVGAWVGRARWLILIGVLLIPVLAMAALVRVPLGGPWGDLIFQPATTAELEEGFEMSVGRMVLDLRGIDIGDATVTTKVSLGAGQLEIVLPEGIGVSISARVGAGRVSIPNVYRDGFLNEPLVGTYEGEGMLIIDADVGFGEIHAWRDTPYTYPESGTSDDWGLYLDQLSSIEGPGTITVGPDGSVIIERISP